MFLFHMVDTTIKKMKSHAANLITMCNLSFGVAAILTTLNDAYSYSVLFIFISAFLDRYDGKVARKFNQESELGKQLDSMGDIISFGIAPALLIYAMILSDFGIIGTLFTILYIACGAFRLARFNISEAKGYFIGLPITAAGTLLTVSYFLFSVVHPQFYLFLVLILSIMMISSFTLKKV